MSDPVWLLTTKGRPDLCQAVLDACADTGMRSRGIVYVDETVDAYQDIRLPRNWEIHYEPVWGGIAAGMNWCFERFPDASHYGWLADDAFPRTPEWDRKIEREAGEWLLAYGQDMYASAPELVSMLWNGTNLGAPLCWGGNLVRAVGWWALPGVKQAGIDTAWTAIVSTLGLYRYQPRIICEHMNYRTGKRPYDTTDSWERNGFNFVQADIDFRDAWYVSPEYQATLQRVRDALALAGVNPSPLTGRKRRRVRR